MSKTLCAFLLLLFSATQPIDVSTLETTHAISKTQYSSKELKQQLQELIHRALEKLGQLEKQKSSSVPGLFLSSELHSHYFPKFAGSSNNFTVSLLEKTLDTIAQESSLFYLVKQDDLELFLESSKEELVNLYNIQIKLKRHQIPDISYIIEDWTCHLTLLNPHQHSILVQQKNTLRLHAPHS